MQSRSPKPSATMPRGSAPSRLLATVMPVAGRPVAGFAAGLATVLLLGLAGCYRPTPVVHAQLRVPAQGDYLLDGQAVPPDRLRERLAAVKTGKAANGDLLVTIELAPAADGTRLRQAVDAVKQVQARVAFDGDSQALKAAASASGVPAD